MIYSKAVEEAAKKMELRDLERFSEERRAAIIPN